MQYFLTVPGTRVFETYRGPADGSERLRQRRTPIDRDRIREVIREY
jgi:hypothetical protein